MIAPAYRKHWRIFCKFSRKVAGTKSNCTSRFTLCFTVSHLLVFKWPRAETTKRSSTASCWSICLWYLQLFVGKLMVWMLLLQCRLIDYILYMFLDQGPTVPPPNLGEKGFPSSFLLLSLLPFSLLPFFFPPSFLLSLLPFSFPSLCPFFLPSFLQSYVSSTSPPQGGGDALQHYCNQVSFIFSLNPFSF